MKYEDVCQPPPLLLLVPSVLLLGLTSLSELFLPAELSLAAPTGPEPPGPPSLCD